MRKDDRTTFGFSLVESGVILNATLKSFHRWLTDAIDKMPDAHLEVKADGDHIVVTTPFGKLYLEEDFVRRGDQLVARVLFCQPPGLLRTHAKLIYVIELREGDRAYFGNAEPQLDFDWDRVTNTWSARNVLKLAYELAIACTEPNENIH
jgi:hypothetical protein